MTGVAARVGSRSNDARQQELAHLRPRRRVEPGRRRQVRRHGDRDAVVARQREIVAKQREIGEAVLDAERYHIAAEAIDRFRLHRPVWSRVFFSYYFIPGPRPTIDNLHHACSYFTLVTTGDGGGRLLKADERRNSMFFRPFANQRRISTTAVLRNIGCRKALSNENAPLELTTVNAEQPRGMDSLLAAVRLQQGRKMWTVFESDVSTDRVAKARAGNG